MFRTWKKRDVSPAFPSNLPVPLIAERIDLIRKLSKIFIRHALTFFNNGNETFSCYHQAVKRAGFCTVNTLCLFLHKLSAALCDLLTGAVIYDVIFGSIATLLAAVCTYLLRNHKIACTFPPVIFNMIIVPFVLVYAYGIPAVYFHGVNVTIPFNAMTVGIGEVISVCVLGSILMRVLAKYRNVMFRATAQ